MSVFCLGRTRDASSCWSSVSNSAWRHVPELGKQCLKHVGMRGWAGLPPADVVMANDRAGWPARTLGGVSRCSHHHPPRTPPPQHFGKSAGSLQWPQNCWMKKPHQLQPPLLAPGMSVLKPSRQCQIHWGRAGACWQVMQLWGQALHLFKTKPIAFVLLLLGLVGISGTIRCPLSNSARARH